MECNNSPFGAGAAVPCVDFDASLTLTTRTVSGVEIEASWSLSADEAGYTCGCTTCSDDAAQYYTYDAAAIKCTFNDVCASVTSCEGGSTCVPAFDAGAETCYSGDAFTCECVDGYETPVVGVDDVTTCSDKNECVTDSHGCESKILNYHLNANATANGDITQRPAECINTIGSFVCGCGHTEFTTDINDEKNSFAVDDCLLATCGANAYCKDLDNIAAYGSTKGYVNLENTFECGCNAGWEPTNCAFAESEDGLACSPEIMAEECKNVDECAVFG